MNLPMATLILISIFIISTFNVCYCSDEDELLLVQALWRHGDRSPLGTFKNDPNQEDAWPQGWGQLSAKGMAQHVKLGAKLKARYIDGLHFVNRRYLSKEIYVRSTDLNRTLTSAIANLIGFFDRGIAGTDYPSERQAQWWPHGFTPVAVHTREAYTDHIIPDVPDVPCPRQSKILQIMARTFEYRQLTKQKKQFFADLSNLTGEQIDLFNLYSISDTLFIEDIYRNELPEPVPEWTQNKTLRAELKKIENLIDRWLNGKDISAFGGVQFDVELPRIRGGPILWILIDNMLNKLNCLTEPKNPLMALLKSPFHTPLCDWIKHIKYFAYSAHDTTIAALFSALGFDKTNYDSDGYPHYSACVTVELWRSVSKGGEPYVKVLYWPPELAGFKDITHNITGCETSATLDQFVARSHIFKPMPSPDEYCKDIHFPSNTIDDPTFDQQL
ncbi:hypothetical protein niasHT_035210 [Heterodera trifolii]|uniref:acid phosphatase n=1 Tax=Heterodera trifolii TaxID=157864 RepID=A0ABD2IHP7_9BILA